ncbi:membrane protein [Spirochaetia bacterium]|nr:membrane protein [Spirochaetia bacterium]
MIKTMKRRFSGWGKGEAAIFCCAILWSTSGLIIKLIDWHPLVIAGGRSLIAALFLLTVRTVFPRQGKRRSRPGPLIAAGFAYALTMITFVIANKMTSAANAILLQYSAPVWAFLLGWILIREKPRWEQWLALGMAAIGFFIFFQKSFSFRGGGVSAGDLVAVLSGVFFGANSVFMRMQKEGNPADSMLLAHVLCTAVALPFLFLYTPTPALISFGALAFMGIVQVGMSSLLFSYGIKRVSAVGAMLIATIEPVLNPVWVFIVTGEKPSLRTLIGGGVIVAAVAVSSILSTSRRRNSYD